MASIDPHNYAYCCLSNTSIFRVPKNVSFEVDDINADWLHTPNSVDYIHVRNMHGAVSNWPEFLKQAFKTLAPGGWLEIQEMMTDVRSDDGSLPEDSPMKEWVSSIRDAMEMIGKTVREEAHIEGWIKDAGYQEINTKYYKLPVGTWPKEEKEKQIGAFCMLSMLETVGMYLNDLITDPEWQLTTLKMCRGRNIRSMDEDSRRT
jgi:hypothetical protein